MSLGPTQAAAHKPVEAPHVDPNDPQSFIGHTIADRYRVDAVLGVGGMGAVLRCYHLGLRRDVAVKLLHPDMARVEEIAKRFAREAESMSRLEHPNCVQVFDSGLWAFPGGSQMRYLAMQLLDGHELTDDIHEPLEPERAIEFTRQILQGLEHAHSRGIVHRDLKPENVFMTHDHNGELCLKLVDFGIAKMAGGAEDDGNLTRLGVVFGTPFYMSPEQAAGGAVDHRTDIYSAGVLLYRMLAGRIPFDDVDLVKVVRMQIGRDPPPLPDSVPPPLRDLVLKMMAKDRDERFQDTASVLTALDELVLYPPPVAVAPSVTGPVAVIASMSAPLRLPSNRSKVMLGALAGLAVILGLVFVFGGDGADDATASEAIPEEEQLAAVSSPTIGASPDKLTALMLSIDDALNNARYVEALKSTLNRDLDDPRLVVRRNLSANIVLGLVNDDANPLDYEKRHEAIQALAMATGYDAYVDSRLNRVLDLWQAGGAEQPCAQYAKTLEEIQKEPSAYDLGTLVAAQPPKRCKKLANRQAEVRAEVYAKYQLSHEELQVPAAYQSELASASSTSKTASKAAKKPTKTKSSRRKKSSSPSSPSSGEEKKKKRGGGLRRFGRGVKRAFGG